MLGYTCHCELWHIFYDSSVKGARSDDDDEVNVKHETIVDDEKVIGWAKVSHIYIQATWIPSEWLQT